MSWKAKRFRRTNIHHIPPQHPASNIPFKVRVNKLDHAAYHQLFANAATFEDCVAILYRDWWAPYLEATNDNRNQFKATA